MARIICILNQKGGVGKTTTAINLGAGLATLHGKRVLLIDMDPQCSLSRSLDCEVESPTLYDVLSAEDAQGIHNAIVRHDNYDVLPASIKLTQLDGELAQVPGREHILADALRAIADRYEYILIDCPPSLNVLSQNGMVAAKELLIPLQAENMAVEGMVQLIKTYNLVKRRLNPELEIMGLLFTLYDGQRSLSKQMAELVDQSFPGKLLKTKIRRLVSLAEAPGVRLDIFEYAPDSPAANDYRLLAQEIVQQEVRDA